MSIARLLAALASALIGIVALIVLAAVILLSTETGTRWAAEQARENIAGLDFRETDGTLIGTVSIEGFSWRSETIDVDVQALTVDPDLLALLTRSVRISSISIQRASVIVRESKQSSSAPFSGLGIPITINAALVEDLIVDAAGVSETVTRAELSASLVEAMLKLDVSLLQARANAISLRGDVDLSFEQPAELLISTLSPTAPGGVEFEVNVTAGPTHIDVSGEISAPAAVSIVAAYDLESRLAEISMQHAEGSITARAEVNDRGASGTFDLSIRRVPGEGAFSIMQTERGGLQASVEARQGTNTASLRVNEDVVMFEAALDDFSAFVDEFTGSIGVEGSLDLISQTVEATIRGREILGTEIDATYDGGFQQGALGFHIRAEGAGASGKAQIAVSGSVIDIQPERLGLSAGTESWSLARGAASGVRIANGEVSIADLCFSDGKARACIDSGNIRGSNVTARLTINDLERGPLNVPAVNASLALTGSSLDFNVSAAEVSADPVSLSEVRLQVTGMISAPVITLNAGLIAPGLASPLSVSANARVGTDDFVLERWRLFGDSVDLLGAARFEPERQALTLDANGSVFDRPIAANGSILIRDSFPNGRFVARSGDELVLAMTAEDDSISAQLDIPRASLLSDRLSGSLRLDASVPRSLAWSADLSSTDLALDGQAIETLAANLTGQRDESIEGNIRIGSSTLGEAIVTLSGRALTPSIALDAQTPLIAIEADGGLISDDSGFGARIDAAAVTLIGQTWTIDESIVVKRLSNRVTVTSHCWRHEPASLCFDETTSGTEALGITATLRQLPIEQFALPGSAGDVALIGDLGGSLRVSAPAPFSLTTMDASLKIDAPRVEMRYFDDLALEWQLALAGELANKRFDASLLITSNSAHRITATGEIPSVEQPDRFSVKSDISIGSLAVVAAFVPQIANASGSLDANLSLGTMNGHPEISVSASIRNDASVLIPAAGIQLESIDARITGDEKKLDLLLAASSGDGQLNANGFIMAPMSAERTVEINVKGERVTAINLPDIRAIASPDLRLTHQGEGSTSVRGRVVVNDGDFTLTQLRAARRSTSPDVRVVSRDPATVLRNPVDIELETVIEQFAIDLYGVKGKVQGDLNLVQRAGTPRRANGNLRLVDGTFSRFGQSFDVERGRLVFSGPLTNPTVDVVSARTIEEIDRTVKVTLTLFGPANDIRSTLSATPPMSEAAALSYLVLGRALSRDASGEDQNLAAAALVLGLNRATGLTEKFRKTLGLESLSISSGDTTMVVAGKQLSRDLFVEYSYDVLGRHSGFLFDYRLSDRLSLQTRTGEHDSMQLIYSF